MGLQMESIAGAAMPGGRQAGQRGRAPDPEKTRRRHDDHGGPSASAAGVTGRLAGGVWLAAPVDHLVYGITRIPVCQGDAAGRAHHRPASVPPPACLVAALPPEPPDGRHDARYRTGHAQCRFAHFLYLVQHPADPGGNHPRARLSGLALRHLVYRDHGGGAGVLHRVYRLGDELAHAFPPHHERPRFKSQYQGHRFVDQL